MKVFTELAQVKRFPKPVVGLGNFDGVHLGHQQLIARNLAAAKTVNGTPMLLTLDPHPLKILQPEACPPLLLTKDEKVKVLSKKGIEVLVISHFTREMACLEPENFVEQVLVKGLDAKIVTVGYNYSFGQGGVGDPSTLAELARDFGFKVEVVPPVTVDGQEVSSTLIRQLLMQGNVEQAGRLLGYFPYLTGPVVHGARLGRKIGFPTANLDIPPDLVIPDNGVYLTRVTVAKGTFFGVANIGCKPTIEPCRPKNVEVHIFDFADDIYHQNIKVEFLKRIRSERVFADLEQLTAQINRDVIEACEILTILQGNNWVEPKI